MNRPYKKYWEKTKSSAKATFNQVKKYVVNSTPFKTAYNVYKFGKKIYNYTKTGVNIVRNTYNYVKSFSRGEDTSVYKENLKKNLNSKYNPIPKFFNRYWNNNKNYEKTINFIKEKYNKAKSFYDKGKYYYNKFIEFKNKVLLFKNNILNKISEIQNIQENFIKKIETGLKVCPICGKLECQYKISDRRYYREIIENNKEKIKIKINSLIESIDSNYRQFPNMSFPAYNNIRNTIDEIKNKIRNGELNDNKYIYNNLKSQFLNLFSYENNYNYIKNYF